ncbi:MAG: hypothetical protein Q7R95_10620 [bacterium]|nr:hypothetical protein [bacterium]
MYTATSMLAKARSNPIYGKITDNRKAYYRNYLQSEHWKNLRREKLEKNPRCERCSSYLSLDVHHREYHNLYDVLLIDLETLCRLCHDKEHKEHKDKNTKKHRKLNKDILSYNDLWVIFNSKEPNVFLINWILDYIICRLDTSLTFDVKKSKQYYRKRNIQKRKEFDKRNREEHRYKELNNYISIHY